MIDGAVTHALLPTRNDMPQHQVEVQVRPTTGGWIVQLREEDGPATTYARGALEYCLLRANQLESYLARSGWRQADGRCPFTAEQFTAPPGASITEVLFA